MLQHAVLLLVVAWVLAPAASGQALDAGGAAADGASAGCAGHSSTLPGHALQPLFELPIASDLQYDFLNTPCSSGTPGAEGTAARLGCAAGDKRNQPDRLAPRVVDRQRRRALLLDFCSLQLQWKSF